MLGRPVDGRVNRRSNYRVLVESSPARRLLQRDWLGNPMGFLLPRSLVCGWLVSLDSDLPSPIWLRGFLRLLLWTLLLGRLLLGRLLLVDFLPNRLRLRALCRILIGRHTWPSQ